MLSGTQRQDEMHLYLELDQNLIDLSPHAHDRWMGVNMRAPSWRFDQALTIMRDIALTPTFPEDMIDVSRRRLIGNETASVEPWIAGQRNLVAALFGLGHPYSVALASPARDLQRLVREDVVSAWRDMTDPAEATLVVAGDVDPLVVRQSVATLFGGWAHDPARHPAAPVPAPEPAAGSARIVAVDRPGAPQVTIFYGGRLQEDSAAHNAARSLIEELLDQAQARSQTYAAGSEPGASWSSRQHYPAAFWWQKTVAPGQVAFALRQLDGWFGELRDRGPDANDLKAARARVTRRLPRAFETVERVADLYSDTVADDFPLHWVDDYQASADGLTWAEIRRELLAPEQTHIVVVGNLATLMDQLLSLGWGAVEIHDVDGRLLRTVRPGG
jgi:predicted Zn-dependent peptidase